MSGELRKVTFCIGYRNGFDPDATEEERQHEFERTRERDGYFHKWVEESDVSPQTGEAYTKTLALVEDSESGKVYKVETDLVTFKNN